jgi:dTDP-4-amino-4,6-dideoxygalactose transaminase
MRMIDKIALKEVAINVHFIPMPMLSFFKDQGYDIADYPQAYKNFACEISLPVYPQLTNEEVAFVINAVKEAYEKVVSGI